MINTVCLIIAGICADSPINCSNPDDAWQSATRLMTPADYGYVAACSPDWLFRRIEIPEAGLIVECIDTGGAIRPKWRDEVWVFGDGPAHTVGAWVIYIDVFWDMSDGWPGWSLQMWDWR